jgi:ADP-heptose:LPS heptosyltransferase
MLYNPPPRNEIKKIAVLMYGLLGDTLIRTPLLRELRVLYCDAVIVAFADQAGKNALDLTNLTDEIKEYEEEVQEKEKLIVSILKKMRLKMLCVELEPTTKGVRRVRY